eukprot:1982918-Prymnesium_polylepis.1
MPVETGVSNVRDVTSYTPTALAWRGAKTTRFPTAAAPANLKSIVRLPVATDESNARPAVGGHRDPQSVQSVSRAQLLNCAPGPPSSQ